MKNSELQGVYRRTKGDLLSPDELKRIAKYALDLAIGGRLKDLRNAILLRLLVTTGRRIGELLSIRVGDIDFSNRLIMTKIEKQKRENLRPITLDPKTMQLIEKYIKAAKLGKRDKLINITTRGAEKFLKRVAKELGIEKRVTPHSFRHSLITLLRSQGWADKDIILVTGHSNTKSLEHYDHTTFFTVRDRFENVRNVILDDEK